MVLVFLVMSSLYAVRYTSWNAEYLSTHAEEFARNSTLSVLDYNDKQLERKYKEDQYGGATPEETLKLFVEALEKKDFELASKYYVPEKQEGFLKKLESEEPNATDPFINAFKNGRMESGQSEGLNDYGIDIYVGADKIPYSTRFMKNPFTNKWKITE